MASSGTAVGTGPVGYGWGSSNLASGAAPMTGDPKQPSREAVPSSASAAGTRTGGGGAGSGGYGGGRPQPAPPAQPVAERVDSKRRGAKGEQRDGDRPGAAEAGAAAPNGCSSGTVAVAAAGEPNAGPPMSNYNFFVRYTYSNECALLAYNFHKLVTKLGIFEHFVYRHDYRLISVTLAYIFYRYQVHHCDMALDLAVTLVYLEDVRSLPPGELELRAHSCGRGEDDCRNAFNLICYLAFLAHAFNADRTIRLADWYKEIGWRHFKNCQQLNGYVFFLFSQVRQFRLRVSETRVKRYIQKLCSVPSQVQSEK